jgi:hypothetical protein
MSDRTIPLSVVQPVASRYTAYAITAPDSSLALFITPRYGPHRRRRYSLCCLRAAA